MIKTYIDGVLQATPIVLRHNQLIGLNDDVNFQHITATDRTKLNNLSGTNTGDETASTIINKIGDGSKINSNYLPSYVDDVLEFANVASFPATGENGKIYIALDVNLTYRWGGSGYVEISPSIALGETSATAYRGDRGASAYAHSTLTSGTNPHNTTFANIASKPTTIAGYGITDGVTLTGNETLTNKTLTIPVLNTSVTGTAITTTGEAGKLLKTSSLGRVDMTQSVDGNVGVILNNTSSGASANTGFQLKADNDSYLAMWNYGSGRTASILGKTMGNRSAILSQGANNLGLLIGTLVNSPITIGVAGVSKCEIDSANAVWSIPLTATQYKLSALNTAPASATATGILGEIRIDANYIYVCTATNTWKRTPLATW